MPHYKPHSAVIVMVHSACGTSHESLCIDTACKCRFVSCPVCTGLGVGGGQQGRLAAEAAGLLGQDPGLLGTAQGPGVPTALQHLL